jgi:predicted permease
MFYPLWSSSIHLKDICLRVFLVVGFSPFAAWVLCSVFVQFREDIGVVLLSVLLCMLHWLVGFSALLD